MHVSMHFNCIHYILFNSVPVCFLWLPRLLPFINGASVGSILEVFISAKVLLRILGN